VTPTLFLYHPTPTPLHRFGAGPKLAVLVALSVLLFAVTPPVALAAIGAVAVIVTVAAGPSVAVLAGQLRFPAFIVALVALANALLTRLHRGSVGLRHLPRMAEATSTVLWP
jgi:biotin transport system permease protein